MWHSRLHWWSALLFLSYMYLCLLINGCDCLNECELKDYVPEETPSPLATGASDFRTTANEILSRGFTNRQIFGRELCSDDWSMGRPLENYSDSRYMKRADMFNAKILCRKLLSRNVTGAVFPNNSQQTKKTPITIPVKNVSSSNSFKNNRFVKKINESFSTKNLFNFNFLKLKIFKLNNAGKVTRREGNETEGVHENITQTYVLVDKTGNRQTSLKMTPEPTDCRNCTYNNMTHDANATDDSNNANGTVLNAAGRFMSNCLDQMSKMVHCFYSSELAEPTMENITFYLFTRSNNETGEVLRLDDLTSAKVAADDEEYYYEQQPDSGKYYDGYFYDHLSEGGKKKRTINFSQLPLNRNETCRNNSCLTKVKRKYAKRIAVENEGHKYEGFKFGKSVIVSKYFNVKDKTKIIVHGYTQSYTTKDITLLKDAYLTQGSYNIIVVDWSELAKGPCYNIASKYAKSVGALVKDLVYGLAVGGIDMKSVHLIGFSLGAQVAGFAGNDFNTGHVYRITGLDPASPLFTKKYPDDALDAGDARFVDVIHTSHILGQGLPSGHADFYPNGGVTQPGCDKSDIVCSHVRGLLLFTESVKSPIGFPSVRCNSWEMYAAGRCSVTPTSLAYMGEPCTTNVSGLFYLRTGSSAPFAQT